MRNQTCMLVLASASPRRRDLLTTAGISLVSSAPDHDGEVAYRHLFSIRRSGPRLADVGRVSVYLGSPSGLAYKAAPLELDMQNRGTLFVSLTENAIEGVTAERMDDMSAALDQMAGHTNAVVARKPG